MKTLGLLLICGAVALAAANKVVFNEDKPPTVEWQYDGYRERLAEAKKQDDYAKEFNRTNTDPTRYANTAWVNFYWDPHKGDRELGYRSDGAVVWRLTPEANP